MPTIKLTRKTIASLEPGEKPVIYFDETVKGFGLKIMPTGARSWVLEYRPGAGGRGVAKKRLKIGTPATMPPEEARERAIRTLARVTLGGDPAGARSDERSSPTVSDLVDAYMRDHVASKRKAKTEAEYKIVIDKHVKPAIGSMRASVVMAADVARMQSSIVRGKRRNGNTGKTTANRALAVLSAAFNWAQGVGLVPDGHNPTKRVERFSESRKERFLTTSEMTALGEALYEAETIGLPYDVDENRAKAKNAPKPENRRTVYGPHAVAAIRLLLLTGARKREILDLRWQDVDLDRGVLFLADSKTGKKTLVLSSAAIAILQNLPRLGIYVIAGATAGAKGERPRADLNKPWGAVLRRAGLEGVRLHDLRHSFASVGVGGSLGLPIVGKLLGHTQAATTARYAHLDTDPLKKAVDTIGDKISSAMGARR
ncbi:tyrosine-type recombinase/integrase [Shinella kummerowiae]|uniref:Tyrosine-type recombinase/integrase n=1 Tax=Shinella kummerowiae TaxID=417745 RepID=A0A6N8SB95_9HYPH|nr:site-specific integrase [Shinella kummerowiae]MXN45903.1 tyrosine-type recombinase/integrase [Shinella kummerowiae]